MILCNIFRLFVTIFGLLVCFVPFSTGMIIMGKERGGWRLMKRRRSIFFQIVSIVILSSVLLLSFFSVYSMTLFSGNTVSLVDQSNRRTVEQLNNSVDTFYQQLVYIIIQLSSSFPLKEYLVNEPEDQFDYYQMQRGAADFLQSYNGFFNYADVDIILYGKNGCTYSTYESTLHLEETGLLEEAFILEAAKSRRSLGLDYFHAGFTDTTRDTSYLLMAKPLFDPYRENVYGLAVIMISESCFSDLFSNLHRDNSRFTVLTPEGRIFSDTDRSKIGTWDSGLLELAEAGGGRLVEYEGASSMPVAAHNSYFDLWIVQTTDYSVISDTVRAAIFSQLAFSVLVLLAVVLLLVLAIRRITRPIQQLAAAMRGITRHGALQKPPELGPSGCAETADLEEAFSAMFDELERYIGNLLAEQNARRAAELSALQAQINPHFMQNTLSGIRHLSAAGRRDDVLASVSALSGILRMTISDVRECIPLGDELGLLDDYFKIQRMRYGDGIRLTTHVDERCLSVPVPKLLLQPLAENAIFHGFSGNTPRGSITVYGALQNGVLHMEVIDNGAGIAPETLEHILEKKTDNRTGMSHIGISNVHERIRLIYGPEYGLEIVSRLGEGTQVLVRIPVTGGKEVPPHGTPDQTAGGG